MHHPSHKSVIDSAQDCEKIWERQLNTKGLEKVNCKLNRYLFLNELSLCNFQHIEVVRSILEYGADLCIDPHPLLPPHSQLAHANEHSKLC